MSKPVFKDLFKFEGRRNRKSFFLLHLAFFPIIAIFVYLLVIFVVIATYSTTSGGEPSAVSYLLFIPFLGSWVVWFAVTAQRCRDFGWTGWAALLEFIPVIGFIFWLALFFVSGTDGDNRYGPDPLKK